MAGCLSQYFPVVRPAISAMAEEAFNLDAVQATTHPCSPLILVNGPLGKEWNINGQRAMQSLTASLEGQRPHRPGGAVDLVQYRGAESPAPWTAPP